jgi:hypothetical protein
MTIRRRARAASGLAVALAAAGLVTLTAAGPTLAGSGAEKPAPRPAATFGFADPAAPKPDYRPVCPPVPGQATCRALVRTDVSGLRPDGLPNGYGPADLQDAYDLPKGGKGVTVAITGLGGYSKAESDLAAYRSMYGLPACTIKSGCLTLVNQHGQTSPLPPDYSGWWGESALDMDMVSASCPQCKILYVEASAGGNGDTNLLDSINAAVKLKAPVVTNSWGEYDSSPWLDKDYRTYFHHPGHVILFASGDIGYGAAEPNSKYLVMVGSTSLTRDGSGRGWSESVWHGTTSWCTPQNKAARWMPDEGCAGRLMVDVSTVGDPNTGVAVYVAGSWVVEGGTSASSPFVAGIYALAGHPQDQHASKGLYADPGDFYDVTSGSNGSCSPAVFCTAETGYDAPTGLGTPNGVGAFR